MKVKNLIMIAIASTAMFATSCSDSSSHNEHDGHHHATETTQTENHTANQNENGALVDASGAIITGCPMHKEMIGSEGDKCPKCNYMEMIPITWSLDGIDTVRVTNLPDYNPPAE